jgi:phosphoribosyl-ATP pyrophosphohydrolase/phosphoribosyl-AMP cyclohydrolase
MKTMPFADLKFDERGLIPAIVRDVNTGAVLMLAYMNMQSLRATVETREAHYWSRSRQELWRKGASSGNVQRLRGMSVDCDGDALVMDVEQIGNACHTGEYSCFFRALEGFPEAPPTFPGIVSELIQVIRQRNQERPEGSYTTKLLQGGTDRILKKVGEEAGEVIIAAKNAKRDEIAWETADLVYHLLVMLEERGVPMSDVSGELARRFHRTAGAR